MLDSYLYLTLVNNIDSNNYNTVDVNVYKLCTCNALDCCFLNNLTMVQGTIFVIPKEKLTKLSTVLFLI